jgi:Site-specific recombinase XerD
MQKANKEVWISAGRGIRYKEHPTRKQGQKPDRYWCIRYKLNGQSLTEAVGWWSEGASKPRCEEILAVLRKNWRSGHGPQTYKEMREAEIKAAQNKAEAAEKEKKQNITLAEFWEGLVLPEIKLRYAKINVTLSNTRVKTWLKPLLDMPLSGVTPIDLEKLVVGPMLDANMSPATIEAVLRLFSMIWHRGRILGYYQGDSPTATAKRPKIDNRRVRFLSQDEANILLAALKKRSIDAHDMALLSLFTGMRAGECADLTWGDVNFDDGSIFIKDSMKSANRHAYITTEVRAMLKRRLKARRSDSPLVFHSPKGGKRNHAHRIPFSQAVKLTGFNDGIEDDRQKVVFHTLRHTFASWLVQRGHPLYTVSQLMGHRLLKMTERYAHLAPDTLRAASLRLDGFLK